MLYAIFYNYISYDFKINTFIYKTRYNRVAGNCSVILCDFVTCEFDAILIIYFGFKD